MTEIQKRSEEVKETQVTKIQTTLAQLIKSNMLAMPKEFNHRRFLQNCMYVLQEIDPIKLAKCTPLSAAQTFMKGAVLGLDFFNKECYAIPYGDQLSFQTDYKGERKLALKYSIKKIQHIFSDIVRAGDEFSAGVEGGKKIITHVPRPFSDEQIIGAYAVVMYSEGFLDYEIMSRKEIESVRDNYSKQSRGQAWEKSLGEMCKKTVLRRLRKSIELEFENPEQQKIYNEDAEDFEFETFKPIKTKPEVLPPSETTSLPPVEESHDSQKTESTQSRGTVKPLSDRQLGAIKKMLIAVKDDGTRFNAIIKKFDIDELDQLNMQQASEVIKELMQHV